MHKPENILVIGSGAMGSSIALALAMAGMKVALLDIDESALERAVRIVDSGLETLVEYGTLADTHIQAIKSRISTGTDLAAMAANTDFAIEAVPENPEIKKKVFLHLEGACPAETVIASNTSGLNVFGLTEYRHPDRFVIAHFFAPAHIIPLVEVVPGPRTSESTMKRTVDLMQKTGKHPLVLKEFVPSFIVNRIANAMGTAVTEILDNGWATPEDLDRAMKLSWGIRMPIIGVVQFSDFVGIDLVNTIFSRVGLTSPFYSNLVKQGRLGVKTTKGIYDYGERSEEEILKKRDKLFLSMLDHMKKINAFDPV